ncbi:hypothetical protein HDU78_011075, partial [Chytriomyces hyalinus]
MEELDNSPVHKKPKKNESESVVPLSIHLKDGDLLDRPAEQIESDIYESIDADERNDVNLKDGRVSCSHACKDKENCKHLCCKFGIKPSNATAKQSKVLTAKPSKKGADSSTASVKLTRRALLKLILPLLSTKVPDSDIDDNNFDLRDDGIGFNDESTWMDEYGGMEDNWLEPAYAKSSAKRGNGVCSRGACQEPAMDGKNRCELHQGQQAANNAKAYAKSSAKRGTGVCSRGACREPAMDGRSLCELHQGQKAARSAKAYAKSSAKRGTGVCSRGACQEPAMDGKNQCELHQGQQAANNAKANAKRGAKSSAKSGTGVCANGACQEPAMDGKKQCELHQGQQAANNAK